MTESERLTFETELGISIDKNEDCPTMSICWNCDIKVKDCKYFNDVVEKLAKYEAIGTVEDIQEVMALCKSLQETTCKYMDIGTIEEFKALKDINRIADNLSKMERIEFKALKEKSVAKKPYIQQIVKDFREHDCYECPNCDCFVGYVSECQEEHYQDIYCPNCGQKLDWQ